jgi:hypothetical protein
MIRHMTKEAFTQQLSGHLFWDVDRAAVDPEKHRQFLVPRIMDRGTRDDVKAAWSYYGEEKIREALLNARALHKKTIAFFANQFDLSCESFRAFRNQPGTWNQ